MIRTIGLDSIHSNSKIVAFFSSRMIKENVEKKVIYLRKETRFLRLFATIVKIVAREKESNKILRDCK